MASFCILPPGANDVSKLKRVIETVEKRWEGGCELFAPEWYVANLSKTISNVSAIEGNGIKLELTNELIRKIEDKVNKSFKRIIIFTNNEYKNEAIHWSSNFDLKIYRERPYFGYGGLELVHGLSDEDDYKHLNDHIFNKVTKNIDWRKSPVSLTFFPYCGVTRVNMFGDINDIGFRIPDSYRDLLNRPKSQKLIVFFGGSGCMDIVSDNDYMFTSLLQEKLNCNFGNTISVLNFGMGASTITDQIMTYILFLWKLKPDIVISWDGYNELYNGMWNDSYLFENYDLFYMHQFEDFACRINNISTDYGEITKDKNDMQEIVQKYIARKKQFKKIVEGNGGTFISALQPMVSKRLHMSDFEKMRSPEEEYDKLRRFCTLARTEFSTSELNFFDANECIRHIASNDILFADPVHQLPNANMILSQCIYEYLIDNFTEVLKHA